ncbi:hypothetical protein J3R82DRAFT_2809 [Butyriboletus roseoflavus]|nr:hypothetical protein J3R82DRAFT_1287 [Butyriboletus roseoflavus]KAG8220588.1 hypothetical protein J3R82DRAFT_2809 [Butyriboletus roseoflavus]
MSLRQDVLRSLTLAELAIERKQATPTRNSDEDSDEELICVTSAPGTPARSRASSRPSSRPVSPTRRANPRNAPSSTLASPASNLPSSDPLKAFPTQVSQRIFRWLAISDLASCSRVSQKWNKSQTLNYSAWYRVLALRVLTLIKYGFNTIGKKIFTTRACLPASGLEGSRNRIGFAH